MLLGLNTVLFPRLGRQNTEWQLHPLRVKYKVSCGSEKGVRVGADNDGPFILTFLYSRHNLRFLRPCKGLQSSLKDENVKFDKIVM